MRAERERWFQLLEAQRAAFEDERAAWQEERTRLVNALLAKTSGEFALRQRVSEPEPISSMPREAREAPPSPMGL
jgi:hypothetical protein